MTIALSITLYILIGILASLIMDRHAPRHNDPVGTFIAMSILWPSPSSSQSTSTTSLKTSSNTTGTPKTYYKDPKEP